MVGSSSQAAMPALFVSHGAPDLTLTDHPAKQFLETLGARIPRPRAVLVISAHWQAPQPSLTVAPEPETIHDFSGWPPALYDIRYPAKTSLWLIDRVDNLLHGAGLSRSHKSEMGFDHGAWTPLRLMYPEADVPVVQLSQVQGRDTEFHFELGRLLAPLRNENVLILSSGAVTHNLSYMAPEGSPPPDWARAFDTWLLQAVCERRLSALLRFESEAPEARLAHPTLEHFLPFFVAAGAGWGDRLAARIHHSYSYGSLAMDAYAFGTIED